MEIDNAIFYIKHLSWVDLQNGLVTSNGALAPHLQSLFSTFLTCLFVTILYGWKITTVIDDLKISDPVMSHLTRIYEAQEFTDKNEKNTPI